jgi:hypothetical protein
MSVAGVRLVITVSTAVVLASDNLTYLPTLQATIREQPFLQNTYRLVVILAVLTWQQYGINNVTRSVVVRR